MVGCLFFKLEFKFLFQKAFSNCCLASPQPERCTTPYLFLFSYKRFKTPPMKWIRMLQVEKLKTSHFLLAIPWLTIITAVKELWRTLFTQQPLPVYSITSTFFIMIFLLGRLCCTRQEPDKGGRAGPVLGEAVLWIHSCTTQHTEGLEQQPNGLRGASPALQALRGFLHRLHICPQFLLG